MPYKVKMALGSGNREGGILAYDFPRKTRNVDPLFPNSLKEGREGGTAKSTVMFQNKHSICNVTDVEEMGMVGNRKGEMVRKIIEGEGDRVKYLFGMRWCCGVGTFMYVKVMGIRFQAHIVLVIRLCITLSGCRHINIVMCVYGG